MMHPNAQRRKAFSRSEPISEAKAEEAIVHHLLGVICRGGVAGREHAASMAEFHRTYDSLIRERVRRQRITHVDFEDCVQDAWEALLIKLPEFEDRHPQGRFRAWLIVLVDNNLKSRARAQRRRGIERLAPAAEASLPGREPDPAAEVERRAGGEVMERLLADLHDRIPTVSYQAFHMRWIEGRDLPQIAEQLGLSPLNVESRIRWARRKLRDLMARHPAMDCEVR